MINVKNIDELFYILHFYTKSSKPGLCFLSPVRPVTFKALSNHMQLVAALPDTSVLGSLCVSVCVCVCVCVHVLIHV